MAERRLDVLVVGGANTDYLVRGPALPRPGSTVEGDEFQEAPGGKGANQAVAAARLGASVAFVGRVGAGRRGRTLLARLAQEGVGITGVVEDSETASGVALVMVARDGEKQILAAPGANRRLTVRDVADAGDLIAGARVVLLQLEIPLDAVESAIRLGRSAGARIVLDPAPAREIPPDLLRGVHVIRPNAMEAEALTGIKVEDARSARRAAENLIGRGVGAAIVGAPGGNLLLSSQGETWLPHLPVDAVDTTGSGDAFAAALAVCLANGEDLASAARFANAAAALKATKLGAQAGMATREEVLELLSRMDGSAGVPASSVSPSPS